MKDKKQLDIIKSITKICVFAISFVLIVALVSSEFFTGDVSNYSKRLDDAYSFTRDPENTIDVVFVGNSDAYSAFNPIYIWEQCGITSTVSASPHQTIRESQRAVEVLLKTQNPKVIVIEVDMLYDGEKKSKGNQTRLEYFFNNTVKPDKFEDLVMNKYPLFNYHNFWKSLLRRKKDNVTHGYKYNPKTIDVKPKNYMTDSDDVEMPDEDVLSQFDELVNFCFDNDIDVIFTEVFSMVSWSTPRHNAVESLAQQYGVDFIDYNLMYDTLNVNMKTAFRDNRGYHVNNKTADTVSFYIAEYIMKNYNVKSRQENKELLEFWGNDAKQFKKNNKIKS